MLKGAGAVLRRELPLLVTQRAGMPPTPGAQPRQQVPLAQAGVSKEGQLAQGTGLCPTSANPVIPRSWFSVPTTQAQCRPSHVLFHTDADGSRAPQLKASPVRLHHLLRPHNYPKAPCSLTWRGEFRQPVM